MLSTIYNLNLLELVPISKRKDKSTVILMNVIQKIILKHILDNMKYLVFTDRIDEMEEHEVDLVAEELHVDFYDYKASLEIKRYLVKTSLTTHMQKGTKYAIELVMNIFFKNAKLLEWFEYNGTPGTFKIKLDMPEGYIFPDLKKLEENIDSTKRKSQVFEGVEATSAYNGKINYAITGTCFSKIRATADMSNTYFRTAGSIFAKIKGTIQ